MRELSNVRVAILSSDYFEESELIEPLNALRAAGATVHVIAPKEGEIRAMRHAELASTVEVDRTLKEADAAEYNAVVLPGGAINADTLRMVPEARAFVTAMEKEKKPIAAICHAPWLLVSANLVRGKKLTSYYTIQDDIRNAGGHWTDEQVVVDGNWVTSRQPKDLPAFINAAVSLFLGPPANNASMPVAELPGSA